VRSAVVVTSVVAGAVVAGGFLTSQLTDGLEGASSSRTMVAHVVDGDTVVTASGEHVRLIGVDTPERGTCGFAAATAAMRRMVEDRRVELVNPASVQDRDQYDRLLRFVEVDGRDAGYAQIRSGFATARFDSRDGLDPHPREDRYHRADRRHRGPCE
jgi:endonuclease YncB( thermonuclease family)